ncbi:LPS export ABC transporter periplasmic protein LptC [Prochlorococcus sp. AH-716-D22]|nr:LPS export ABC transporter periplasmic protein LptC [Prochlorococcus sp. AH-716-D22]
MNRLYKLLFLIPLIIFGCKNKKIDEKYFTQSINDMNMNIFTKEGDKLLLIKSPYSYYDKATNKFNLKETSIKIFKDNKLEYKINSDKSKLSNNNKLIELNGNVLIKTINQKDNKLTANSFTWNIKSSEYLLVGNVKLENSLITLSSNKAILKKGTNIIEFFNPVKYKLNDSAKDSRYEINSENAYYNINTKSVIFKSKESKVRSKIYF